MTFGDELNDIRRRAGLPLKEALIYDPQAAKPGLIYRWVESGKASSNLKTNSLNPGNWVHYFPPPVAKEGYLVPFRGISFGLNPKDWASGARGKSDLCFVVDRSKLNPKKVAEFPGQAAYDLTLDVGPNPPDYQRSYPVPIQNANPGPLESFERDVPDEVFYMGIIRPLNNVLVQIMIKQTATSAMRKKVEAYVQKFGTEVTEV